MKTILTAVVGIILTLGSLRAQISGGEGGGSTSVIWGNITGTIGDQSDLQSQLATKQDADSDLASIAGLATTAYGRTFLTLSDFAAARSLLALTPGTDVQVFSSNLLLYAAITPSANIQSLLASPDYGAVRSLLSLVPGTNIQAFDTELAQIAGLVDPNANRFLYWNDATNSYAFAAPGAGLTLSGGIVGVMGSEIIGITGPQVAFADNDANFAAANVQEAIEELDDNNTGGPNAGNAKVDWTQLGNMPPGFADGVDNEGGGGGGADPDAIHDNVSGEIAAITDKATPIVGDHLLIEDSAASNAKKDITINSLKTPLEGILTLQTLQGAVTDAQIPNNITIDLATLATTAGAGDSATAFFTTGLLERVRGGTGTDTSGFGVGLLGSDAGNATIDVDTPGELETAIGGVNLIQSTEIDTMLELETLVAGVNILLSTELDSAAEFDTVLGVGGTPSASNFLRGDWTWGTVTATAAGSDGQVQFNDGGAVGADSAFTYNKTTDVLSLQTINVTTLNISNFSILDNVDQSHGVTIVTAENLTSNINLNLDLDGVSRSLNLTGNAVLSGTNTGDQAPANPTASVGLTAVNGSAATFMRSDAAPALSLAITPTWSGLHIFNAGADVKNGATSSGIIRIFEDSDLGTNFASFQVPSLAANTSYTLPPDDGDPGEQLQTDGNGLLTWETAGSGGGVTASSTDTFTNKTIDAAATGNVVKFKSLPQFTSPNNVDGTNCVIGTTSTAVGYGRAVFSNEIDQNTNFCQFRIIVPADYDVTVTPRVKIIDMTGGADTGTRAYVLGVASIAVSGLANAATAGAVPINMAADAGGVNGDINISATTSLTTWNTTVTITPGQLLILTLARDGNDGTLDASTFDSTLIAMELEYGSTQ